MIVFNATEDKTVRNSTTNEIVKIVKNPQNKVVDVNGADHLTITIE
jgi:hypothetical protein